MTIAPRPSLKDYLLIISKRHVMIKLNNNFYLKKKIYKIERRQSRLFMKTHTHTQTHTPISSFFILF